MKRDYELDVDERLNFFNNLAGPTKGFVVLDTCILGEFGFLNLLKPENLHGQELKKTLSAECDLLERLHNLFKEKNFVFPPEVRGEYKFMTNLLEDYGKYNGENGLYIPLIRARHQLFNDLPHILEILPNSILQYGSTIDDAIMDISHEIYESNPYLKLARTSKFCLPANAFNDERIIAKSFALSYLSPTRIVSGDRDFIEIYKGLVLNADRFMQRGVPSLPDNPLELVFVNKSGNTELFNFDRVRRHQTHRDS